MSKSLTSTSSSGEGEPAGSARGTAVKPRIVQDEYNEMVSVARESPYALNRVSEVSPTLPLKQLRCQIN